MMRLWGLHYYCLMFVLPCLRPEKTFVGNDIDSDFALSRKTAGLLKSLSDFFPCPFPVISSSSQFLPALSHFLDWEELLMKNLYVVVECSKMVLIFLSISD